MADTNVNKPQKVAKKYEILVSIYYCNDEIVSLVGVQSEITRVAHNFLKKDFKAQDLLELAKSLSSKKPFGVKESDTVVGLILDERFNYFTFPELPAKKIPSFGNMKHALETAKVERA